MQYQGFGFLLRVSLTLLILWIAGLWLTQLNPARRVLSRQPIRNNSRIVTLPSGVVQDLAAASGSPGQASAIESLYSQLSGANESPDMLEVQPVVRHFWRLISINMNCITVYL
ncbi:MAG: hypothetical protein R3C14_34060 [Caldilineaceae bacterium]